MSLKFLKFPALNSE